MILGERAIERSCSLGARAASEEIDEEPGKRASLFSFALQNGGLRLPKLMIHRPSSLLSAGTKQSVGLLMTKGAIQDGYFVVGKLSLLRLCISILGNARANNSAYSCL